MDSVRFPANFSCTEGLGMRNNHLHNPTATTATTVGAAASTRMPDSSHNLNLLNQHVNANPVAGASMGGGGSKLFFTTQIESRDELDDKHERCYNLAMSCISGKSEKEAIDALTITVGKDPRAHEDACHGLLILILTSSSGSEGEFSGSRCFRDLTLINRDGLTSVLSHLTHLILEKYLKLLPHVKNQLIWLIRELVRNNVSGMDSVVWNLMRQIAGGDVSRGNLWLADSLLDLFNDFRSWLSKFPFLVASVAYTYLRLLEDHASSSFEKIREKEVRFVVSIVRDQFNEVMTIGRDFVRILQHVARLPEISDLWKDLLYHPRTLSPSFSGLSQLMETRTSRRFLQCRITPEMEKKLVFLTSQVKFGSHKRYQDWFQRQYLSTPESQSLRCDLIRFIVGVIHPTNELLCSDIIPRWAVIGWLLTTCTSQVAASNAKLALFYDWLFFEPEKDNIMNIEPAILVMHHSIKPHPAITATLLDFLCRIITNFFPKEQEKVRNGIYSSLKQILEKRVLPSLSPLFDNPKMDQELKFLLRERFSPFVNDTTSLDDPIDVNTFNEPMEDLSGVGPEFSDDEAEVVKVEPPPVSNATTESKQKVNKKKPSASSSSTSLSNTNNNSSQAARKESSKPSSPVKVRKRPVKQSSSLNDNGSAGGGTGIAEVDLGDNVKKLLSDLKSSTRRTSPVNEEDNIGIGIGRGGMVSSDDEVKCEVMDELIRVIVSEEFSYEQCKSLAQRLSDILSGSFQGRIYPAKVQQQQAIGLQDDLQEAFQDSVGKPIFVAFRALCDMVDNLEGSGILLQVLADLYALQPRVGYYLLYFLSVDKQAKQRESKTKAAIYKDLCETIDANYCLDICLVNDMRQCQEDDVDLFLHLIPDVYNNFAKAAVGNVNMLYLVVSCVDGRHIQQLLCHLLTKDLLLFKKDSFTAIITASLGWETFEQCALWQLIGAHDIPIDCIYTILPKLSFEKHPEALAATLLRLRVEKPNSDLIRHMLSREPVTGDKFVSTCLSHWLFEHEDKMADLISSYLSKQTSSSYSSSNSSSLTSNLKRKRGGAGSSSSSHSISRKAEMALTHLDELRKLQNSRQYDFFNHPHLQKAVKHVRQSCSDEQKKKFMDLFAIAETDSDNAAGDDNNENDNEEVTLKSSSSRTQSSKTNRSSKNSNNSKTNRKPAVIQDDNDLESSASDDNSDDEDNRPLLSGHRKKHHNNSSSSSRGSNRANNKSRKRPSSKSSSYGAVIIDSSENTSDEETNAKKKKRRKKASAAHSDSD